MLPVLIGGQAFGRPLHQVQPLRLSIAMNIEAPAGSTQGSTQVKAHALPSVTLSFQAIARAICSLSSLLDCRYRTARLASCTHSGFLHVPFWLRPQAALG
jgi:hypothetical protein